MLATNSRSRASEDAPSNPSDWLDRYGDYLYRYALLRLRDPSAAEDAVRDTLLAALHSPDRTRGSNSELTRLVGMLRHQIIGHQRKISRAREASNNHDVRHEDYDPFQATGKWAGHWRADLAPTDWQLDATAPQTTKFFETLDRCLAELPQRTAMAFALREIDGLSFEEICDVMNLSRISLRVMLHRARMNLRGCLEAQWYREKHSRLDPGVGKRSLATENSGFPHTLKLATVALKPFVRIPRPDRLMGWKE